MIQLILRLHYSKSPSNRPGPAVSRRGAMTSLQSLSSLQQQEFITLDIFTVYR